MDIKKADWVTCKGFPIIVGIVERVAKDFTWADVKWSNGNRKRMNTKALEVQHTIPFMGGCVTDMNREKELREKK